MDLRASLAEPVTLQPMERLLIPTGMFIELPPQYEAQVRPRSGLAIKHGITCLNSPGTVDADYRGELLVTMWTFGDEATYEVRDGDRVAQLVVAQVAPVEIVEAAELTPSSRADGGHGSTGR